MLSRQINRSQWRIESSSPRLRNNNFPQHPGVNVNIQTESIRIRNHPRYKDLVSRRRKFLVSLTTATLVPFCLFILVAAFMPQLLARKISATSIINIGWPLGLAFIVGAWLLTGLYILRANGEFDELTAEIRQGAEQ
nr:DUF485 domain-containing protein [Pseudomonas gingeri]